MIWWVALAIDRLHGQLERPPGARGRDVDRDNSAHAECQPHECERQLRRVTQQMAQARGLQGTDHEGSCGSRAVRLAAMQLAGAQFQHAIRGARQRGIVRDYGEGRAMRAA